MAEATAATPVLRDVEEFLAWAEGRTERWQFVEGRLVMMAGAADPHDFLTVNVILALGKRLEGSPCRPHGPDRGVRIGRRNFYLPDVSVSCRRSDGTVSPEPVLVVEVLSLASERDHRGVEWRNYQQLASLRHDLPLSRDEPVAELFSRGERGWTRNCFEGLDAEISLEARAIALPMAERYRDEGAALPVAPELDDPAAAGTS
jgi:Uma2 family endonuclease